MKPITEEQCQALITNCEKEIIHTEEILKSASLEIGWRKLHEINLLKNKIALASLIAEPKAYAVSNNFWNTPDSVKNLNDMHCDLFFPGAVYRGQEFNPENYDHCVSLYTAPPVPVIKLPDVKELPCWVNDDDDFLRWYESETKSLNGLGE